MNMTTASIMSRTKTKTMAMNSAMSVRKKKGSRMGTKNAREG